MEPRRLGVEKRCSADPGDAQSRFVDDAAHDRMGDSIEERAHAVDVARGDFAKEARG